MTGFTDRTSQNVLNHITGKSAMFSLPVCYVGLFTAVGSDAGTGFTECSGGSYARVSTVAADWAAASGTSPSSITNANSITFPAPSGSWGTAIAVGLFDALTVGNLLAWDYLGSFTWLPATVSSASPAVITSKSHGFSAADIIIWTLEYGGTNPTFTASNFTGQLAVVSPATDTFTVTNAATAVNTSATGSGMIRKIATQAISTGPAPLFSASSLVIRSS